MTEFSDGFTSKEIIALLAPEGFKKGSFSHFRDIAGVVSTRRIEHKSGFKYIYPPDSIQKIRTAWLNDRRY
jgi:hypothetical protein